MTTFRPDTSFPYLAYALSRGIDYGDVLRYAEMLKAFGYEDSPFDRFPSPRVPADASPLSREHRCGVVGVYFAELRRRGLRL